MSELAIPETQAVDRAGEPLRDGEWEKLAKVANTIAGTEFVPKGLRGNKPAVMACILYGRDQGLSPMVALSEVHMVDGKPTMSAALVGGKVRLAGHRLWAEEIFDDKGEIVAMRACGERCDDGTRDAFTFSLAMARRAGLAGKQNWKNYPEAMLWARAVTGLSRRLFSDVFMGSVYTADELGAETDEDGQVLVGEVVDEGSAGEPQTASAQAGATEPVAGSANVGSQSALGDSASPAGKAGVEAGTGAGSGQTNAPTTAFRAPATDGPDKPCAQCPPGSTQAKTLKKLDVTVVKGRDAGYWTTADVYEQARLHATQAGHPDMVREDAFYLADDGELHYSDLRSFVPLWLASQLIDYFEGLGMLRKSQAAA